MGVKRDGASSLSDHHSAEGDTLLQAALDSMLDPHAQLQAVFDGDAGIVDFTFREVNRAACAYLGRERGQLVGTRVLSHYDGEQARALVAWCTDALSTGEPLIRDDETMVSAVTGSLRRFDVRGIPMADIVSLTWRDVSDRSAASTAMATSEAYYRTLADNSIDVVLHTGTDGVISWASPSVANVLGWRPDEVVGRRVSELMHPEDLVRVRSLQLETLARGELEGRVLARFVASDGGYRWMSDVGRALVDDKGALVGGIDSLRDVQAEHDAREALALSEEHYRLLAENSSDIVFRTTHDSRVEWISPSVEEVLGWQPLALVGMPILDLIHRDDRSHVLQRMKASGGPGVRSYEARFRSATGSSRWMGVTVRPVFHQVGGPVVWIGSARDIQAERETRDELRRSEERFRTAMESAPAGMAVVGLDHRFMEVNPALSRLLLRSEDWLLRHSVTDVMDMADCELTETVRSAVMTGAVRSGAVEHQMVRADGTRIWVEHSIGLLRDDTGAPSAFVCQFTDVTEPREARNQMRFLATHDSLTELVNRRELVLRIETLLRCTPRSGVNVGMLFVDLDGLKQVNDTHGHGVGDQVIVAVASRIREQVRGDDIVARFGGDEFVVVLPCVRSLENAEALARKIQKSLEAPVAVGGALVPVTASIGVALAEPGDDPDAALRRADSALYRAKREGRARTVVYDASLDV